MGCVRVGGWGVCEPAVVGWVAGWVGGWVDSGAVSKGTLLTRRKERTYMSTDVGPAIIKLIWGRMRLKKADCSVMNGVRNRPAKSMSRTATVGSSLPRSWSNFRAAYLRIINLEFVHGVFFCFRVSVLLVTRHHQHAPEIHLHVQPQAQRTSSPPHAGASAT